MYIKFEKVDDVIEFVKDISKFDYDIDLKKGKYIVPANSMMGIFGIGISGEFELIINEEDDNICKDVINYFKKLEAK